MYKICYYIIMYDINTMVPLFTYLICCTVLEKMAHVSVHMGKMAMVMFITQCNKMLSNTCM